MDMLPKFLINCQGLWKCNRSYAYPQRTKSEAFVSYINLDVVGDEAIVTSSKNISDTSLALINPRETTLHIDGKYLVRSNGYFSNEETRSVIVKINPSYLYTTTYCGELTILDEIQFITKTCRTRTLTAFSNDGTLKIAGTSLELKLNG